MSHVLSSVAAWALCYAGMTALALTLNRHYAQMMGPSAPSQAKRIALRVVGWLFLTASLIPVWKDWQEGIGLVAWCGLLTLAASLVAWLLPYLPRFVAGSAVTSGVVAIGLMIY